MISNIKKLFLPKTEMHNKQVLQDPGYVKRNKNRHNRLDLRHLFLMSKELKVKGTLYGTHIHSMVHMLEVSKVHLIYIVDSNTKYSNYMKL